MISTIKFYLTLVGAAVLLLAAPLVSVVAATSGIGINPMSIALSPSAPIVPITISNRTDQAVILQTEVVSWNRQKGQDLYLPTHDIIATPPIAKLPAGGVQTLRVGLLRQKDLSHESMYRIYITELPTRKPDQQGIALQFVLRIGLPIWVAPAPALYRLSVSAHPTGGGIGVKIINNGNAHVKLIRIVAFSANGKQVTKKDDIYNNLYPGESTQLTVPVSGGMGSGGKVQVITDPASTGTTVSLS